MENGAGEMVIGDKIDSLTVISNLVWTPQSNHFIGFKQLMTEVSKLLGLFVQQLLRNMKIV